jgi:hypothetical protein
LMAPEHALVAKQWSAQQKNSDQEHFFAVLDFADGNAVYQRVSRHTAWRDRQEGADQVVL